LGCEKHWRFFDAYPDKATPGLLPRKFLGFQVSGTRAPYQIAGWRFVDAYTGADPARRFVDLAAFSGRAGLKSEQEFYERSLALLEGK
jgi:hypothetical protein